MSEAPPPRHRVIHWNPESGSQPPASSGQPGRKWLVLALAAATVAFGVLAAILAWRTWAGHPDAAVRGGFAQGAPIEPSFVSQARAELARETAFRALADLRRLPQDHPSLLQQLILIEKGFLVAERMVTAGDFTGALQRFEDVNAQIETYTRTIEARREATRLYDDVLKRLKPAERVRALAPEDYDRAFTAAGEGKMLLEQGTFMAAWQAFETGVAALDALEAKRKQFIDDRIWEGQAALAEGKRETAEAAFRAALTYDAGNEAASRGLRRAATIEKVHALLQQAAADEAAGRYAAAAATFGEAFALDAFSTAAQQGKERAARLDLESRFDAALAAGRAAEQAQDWATAVNRFEDAAALQPKREDVKEALARAKAGLHQSRVRQALAEAYALEKAYEWEKARQAYVKVLDLEADHPDATEGLIRTGRTLRALLEYDKLIETARAQADAAQFQPAIRTFNAAMALKPSYLPLSEEAAQLRSTLQNSNEPVEVRFRSDGRTWVTISNYRLLGKIREEAVKILPGDYEIIGRRKGYKDVFLLLRVRPGNTPREVTVICEERASP